MGGNIEEDADVKTILEPEGGELPLEHIKGIKRIFLAGLEFVVTLVLSLWPNWNTRTYIKIIYHKIFGERIKKGHLQFLIEEDFKQVGEQELQRKKEESEKQEKKNEEESEKLNLNFESIKVSSLQKNEQLSKAEKIHNTKNDTPSIKNPLQTENKGKLFFKKKNPTFQLKKKKILL